MANHDDARKQALRAEYVGRINRVMDYIEAHLDGEVGKNIIPAGKYAVGRLDLSSQEFEEAWTGVMGGWLPQSGYQCDDRPCVEIYLNDPKQHPQGKCIVDICVPVKPL